MDIFKINKKNKALLFLLMIIVFVLNLLYITSINAPYVQADEYGYLGIAAYLAKIDWTDMLNSSFYFSFGYPLIIYPLFLIFDNPIYIYKGAMVINSLLIVFSIPLIYLFINSLNNTISKKILFAIVFLLSFNSITVSRANSSLSEALLIFLFWAIIYNFRVLVVKFSSKRLILISFLLGYSYMVHQRSMVFIIASFITLLIMVRKKDLNIKDFLKYLFIIAIFIYATSLVKSYFINNIWLNDTLKNTNGYSSIVDSLVKLFTLNGFLSFLRNLVGHFFYFGQSTFLIGFVGIYFLIKDFFSIFKKNKSDNYLYFLLFFILCYLGTLFLSCLFFISPSRVDTIMYGRYSEMTNLTITCYGVVRLLQLEKITYKLFLVLSTILFLLTVIVNKTITSVRELPFASLNSPMLHPFKGSNDYIHLYVAFFVTFLLSLLIFTCLKKLKLKFIALLIYSVISSTAGYYMLTENVEADKYMFNINKDKLIELRNSTEIENVYFLYGSDIRKPISYIQYYLFDKKLTILNQNNIDFIKKDITNYVKKNDYLITDYISPTILENFTLDKFGGKLFFLKPKQSDDNSKIIINAYDLDIYKNNSKNGYVQSDGTSSEQTILYSPKFVLEKGSYTVSFNIELLDYNENNSEPLMLVSLEGSHPKSTFIYKKFNLQEIPSKRFICSFDVKNITKNEEVSFVVTSFNNTILKVNNVAIAAKK